ncbi:hypothetical protein [Kutzneria sp. CA-103260]|uniref:hypothetical protein n=1 Tax=Kutzneria sp. CA-103260 TaxID=2802641 RepID=UPI001BAB3FF3|nr:hypothetical protein [Kutzneria sp. CA-103260]QUQ66014.1 hypothetical protein JJ691_37390 [Kutzneria sp. CA-103260]
MDPYDPTPPGGDARRLDRLLTWAATIGALGCSVVIFLATNTSEPEPVAEPVPTTGAAFPVAESTTTTTPTTTTTTTTVAPPTTTAPRATTQPPRTTTGKRITTTTKTTTQAPTSTRRCQAAQWQRDTAYSGGAVVAYAGQLWMAKWWNYNAIPGANAEGVWIRAQAC